MQIDVREAKSDKIASIRFADPSQDGRFRYATKVVNYNGYFYIEDEDDDNSIRFDDRQQVENCIKALQKAMELNWI